MPFLSKAAARAVGLRWANRGMATTYRDAYAVSTHPVDRETFWAEAAKGIDWMSPQVNPPATG